MRTLLLLGVILSFSVTSSAQTWQAVGGGLNSSTHCLTTWNGKLVVGGSFNNNPCDRIALWNGTNFECLANGVGIVARDACVWQGNLVVVGDFWNNSQPCVGCNGVAVWNGTAWTPLGTGLNNDVLVCTVWNNQLVVAGDFTTAGGQPISRIAKWNGTAWEGIGTPTDFTNDIRAMVEFEGELWVGGDFNNVAGCTSCDGLVKWDAATTSWVGGNSGVDLIGGVDQSVRVLYLNPTDGNLYMGGEFIDLHDGDAPAPDPNMDGIAMYDGSNWTPLGTGLNEYCRAIHEYNGNVVAGGWFTTAGGVPANRIAKWNGTTWSPMGLGFDLAGIDEYVKAAAVWNGIFFAGGAYTQAEGNPMSFIAQWYEAPVGSPTPWINYSSQTLCGSGCIDFLDNSTNNPTSWNWTFPGSNTPTSTLQNPGSVCWSAPGNYNVTLQACNSFGCNTQTLPITVTSGATVTVNDAAICGAGSATLTATPSVSGGSFLWSPGGETTASITVNPASTTNYTVTYSYLGCSSSDISTVTVNPPPATPTISAGSATTFCAGGSVTLTSSSASGNQWNLNGTPIGGAINQAYVATASGNYTVIATVGGCTSATSAATTVTVNPAPATPTSSASGPITFCTGGSVTLTSSSATGNQWYLNGSSIGGATNQTYVAAASGNYTVIVTASGCSSAASTATAVTVNPIPSTPTISAGAATTFCAGGSVTLTSSSATGNQWYLNGTPIGGATNQTYSATASGSYTVIVTASGCSSTASAATTVNVNPSPPLPFISAGGATTFCIGGSLMLTSSSATGNQWYLNGTPIGGATNQTYVVMASGMYTLVVTIGGCSSPTTPATIVTVNPIPTTPTISAGAATTFCAGGSVTLTSSSATGNQWYLNGSSIGGATNQTYVATASGNYTVIATVGGCTSAASAATTVTVNPAPATPTSSAGGPTTLCVGGSVTLTSSSATGNQWYLNGSSIGGATSQTYVATASGNYTVIVTASGCASAESATTTVTVNPVFNTSENIDVCIGSNYTFPDGTVSSNITVNESHVSNLTSANGCDSTVTTNLNAISVFNETENNTICSGEDFTYPDGTVVTNVTSNESYVSNLVSTSGCDSIVTTNLTVNPLPDLSVSAVNVVLTSNQGGASYQWIDCDLSSPIANETNQSFTASVTGNYAVEVNLDGCIGTSDCLYTVVGLDELNVHAIQLFPNPVEDFIFIESSQSLEGMQYEIVDVQGRLVRSGNLGSAQLIDVHELTPSTYIIRFSNSKGLEFIKL